jgi:hypothetical protein
MPSVSNEIISDITEHIRMFGGDFSACCVGTARDWRERPASTSGMQPRYFPFKNKPEQRLPC